MARAWIPGVLGRTAAVVVVTSTLLTGCVSDPSCSGGRGISAGILTELRAVVGSEVASASCAAGVEYEGRFYMAWSDRLPIAQGEPLGEAVYPPPCEGGCLDADDEQATPVQVWAMHGADPEQVLIAEMEGSGKLIVYGRLHADPDDYFRFAGGTWHVRSRAAG
jgi:hypothetical protein